MKNFKRIVLIVFLCMLVLSGCRSQEADMKRLETQHGKALVPQATDIAVVFEDLDTSALIFSYSFPEGTDAFAVLKEVFTMYDVHLEDGEHLVFRRMHGENGLFDEYNFLLDSVNRTMTVLRVSFDSMEELERYEDYTKCLNLKHQGEKFC